MADGNWIKLSRKIRDNFIWDFDRPKYAMAWIDMILMANYKDKKILFDGKVKVIPRGSFITSLAKLSTRWRMNERTVKRFLETLRDNGMITFECTNRYTAVFISNYNAFQDFEGNEYTAEYTAEYTPEYTAEYTQHKKVKKSKKCKEEYIVHSSQSEVDTFFESIWELYPVKKGKSQVSAAKRRTLHSVGYEELKRAIDRYTSELKKDAAWRKPQNGSTFFNSGYIDYLDKNYKPNEEVTNGNYGSVGRDPEEHRIGNYL